MAVTLVQSVAVVSSTTSTASYTFTLSPTGAGNLVVFSMVIENTGSNFTGVSVTDNGSGNAWNTVTTVGGGVAKSTFIGRCLSISAGVTSVTVTPTGATGSPYYAGSIQEVSGGLWTDDQHISATSTGQNITLTNPAVDAGTTDFVTAIYGAGAGSSATNIQNPPTGYTSTFIQQDDNNYVAGESCYRINTVAVTDTVSWTASGQSGNPASMASFQVSGGVVPIYNLAWYYM